MNEKPDQTTWKEFPMLIIKGFFMGCADIIPGVSGGTIAFIMGIYQRLLAAIASFNPKALQKVLRLHLFLLFQTIHWKFLLSIILGIGLAITFFTQIIPLANLILLYPTIIFGLFFGLIVGSIILLLQYYPLRKIKNYIWIFMGVLFGGLIISLGILHTPNSPWFIFLAGVFAICAMVLPGISGAYILIILNKYQFILQQLQDIRYLEIDAILNILYFMLGAFVGVIFFVRLLLILLSHFKFQLIYFLVGLLFASLLIIWPYQHRIYKPFVKKEITVQADSPQLQHAITTLPETPKHISLYYIKPDQKKTQKEIHLQHIEYRLIESYFYIPFMPNEKVTSTYQWIGLLNIFLGVFLIMILNRIKKPHAIPI